VGVVLIVALVPGIGVNRELVSARLADGTHHFAGVEAAGDEFLGQAVEQRRVGRWVAGADVVHRLDDAHAEKIAPDTVDVTLGEIGVLLGDHPVGQLLAARGCRRRQVGVHEREYGRSDRAGARMLHIARIRIGNILHQRSGAVYGRAADLLALKLGVFLPADLCEERGQIVILVLRPTLEWVVVALIAVEAHGQEQLRRVFHGRVGVAQNLVVACWRVVEVRP